MEPYNSEKSWLEFKFNKEQAKEQLKQTIPGLRALMYMHDNPESSALETLDLAAEDFVPFYAATKYGAEPSDFAKEALLIGTPVKFGRMRNDIMNNRNVSGPYYEVNIDRQPGRTGDVYNTLAAEFSDGEIRQLPYGYIPAEAAPGISTTGNVYKIGNSTQALKYIDDSEQYLAANPNPYDYKVSLNEPIVKEGNSLRQRERNLEDDIDYYYNKYSKYKLKPNESYVVDLNGAGISVKDNKGNHYYIDDYGNKHKYLTNKSDKATINYANSLPTFNTVEDLKAGIDKFHKDLQQDIKLYNALYGDDVYYKDRHDWLERMVKARDLYYKNQIKDFYENVNPKKPWPYGD